MFTDPYDEGPDQLCAEERRAINEKLLMLANEVELEPDVIRSVPTTGAVFLHELAELGAIDARYQNHTTARTSMKNYPRLTELLADALAKRDFSAICRLQLLRPTATWQQSAKNTGMWPFVNEEKKQSIFPAMLLCEILKDVDSGS